jgi:hypothetical protein
VFSSSLEDEPIEEEKSDFIKTKQKNIINHTTYNTETVLADICQHIGRIRHTVLEKIWRGSLRWPRLNSNIKAFASPG